MSSHAAVSRRSKQQQQGHYHAGPNMTPLVDVVMVILVFLMLTATFNTGWVLPAPRVSQGMTINDTVPMPKADILDLDVDAAPGPGGGGYAVRVGTSRFAGGGEAPLLLAHLRTKRSAFEAVGAKSGDVQVVVRPARGVAYRDVIAVYETALTAGFSKVGFAPTR